MIQIKIKIILFASLTLVDIYVCQQQIEQPTTTSLLFCKSEQYLDTKSLLCKKCNSSIEKCDQCLKADECLKCKYGNKNEKECLEQNKKCDVGYIFDESLLACIKCKSDFCDECNQNHHCLKCSKGFEITENYTCQLEKNTDFSNLNLSCPIGKQEKSGQCLEKSVCSSVYLNDNQQTSKNLIQVIEFKDKIFMINKDSILVYSSKNLNLLSQLIDISYGTEEKIIKSEITKNYMLVLSNKFIYLFNLGTLKYINKQILQTNEQNIETDQKFMFSNQENDGIYYLSILSSKPKLRVVHIEISNTQNFLKIKSDYIFLQSNKLKLSLVTYLYDQKIVIAINQQSLIIINMNKIDKDNPDKNLIINSFQISESTNIKDEVFQKLNQENLILYFVKSTNLKQYIQKVVYNQQTNKMIKSQTEEIKFISFLKSEQYQISQLSTKTQQINDKVYISSQIGYKLSLNYSTYQELLLVVFDVEYVFDSNNKESFYYKQDKIQFGQSKDPVNIFLSSINGNLNEMKIITADNGQIKLFKIVNRNQSQPEELQQKMSYSHNHNDQISFQQSNQEQSGIIIIINSSLTVFSLEDLNKNELSLRQNQQPFNHFKDVYFSSEEIQQVIVPQYLNSITKIKYSFFLISFKNQRQFEIIQTTSRYDDINVQAKTLISIQDQDSEAFSISEDSFCSEEEQSIYAITKRGIYVIEFHTLRILNFIPLFRYLIRNQNTLMSIISNQSLNNNEQVIIVIQLVLMNCEKGKCENFIEVQNFSEYLFVPNNQLHQIRFNPFNSNIIFVQYQIKNDKLTNKIFVENQEIELNSFESIQSISFLSETQFGYFFLDGSFKASKITVSKDKQEKWKKIDEVSYNFKEKWHCEQLIDKKFCFCFLNLNKDQFISLFDWSRVSLVSNAEGHSDAEPIQYLFLNKNDPQIYRNYEYESSRVTKLENNINILIILTQKEEQDTKNSQHTFFKTFYFDLSLEIFDVKDEICRQWYIDEKAKLKQIAGYDFYMYRSPFKQNHVRILFGDSNNASGYIGIDDDNQQDNYSFWKQDNSLIYQDKGQALILKRQGELKFSEGQSTYSLKLKNILFCQKLGLMIVQKENFIEIISLDTYEVQQQVKQLQPNLQLFWSEKYSTLIIVYENKLQVYDASNNIENKIFNNSYNKTFSDGVMLIERCVLFQINPILACNQVGIIEFQKKIFREKKEFDVISLKSKFQPIPCIENKNVIIAGYGQRYFSVYEISKDEFLENLEKENVIQDNRYFTHPQIDTQFFYTSINNRVCGIISIPNFKTIKEFKFVCELNEQMQSLIIFQKDYVIAIYKLPIDPFSQPIISQSSFVSSSMAYFNNFKYKFLQTYNDQSESSYIDIYKTDILTGKTTSQTQFFDKEFYQTSSTYQKYWEEKNLHIFPNIIISDDEKRQNWLLYRDVRLSTDYIGDYSYRYNYIFVKTPNFISLDISEIFPFNKQQNDLYNTLKVKNINYYFKSIDEAANSEKNDFIISFNQKQRQIIKYYFTEKVKQEVLFDFNEVPNMQNLIDSGYSEVYKTPYKIVHLIDDKSKANNQIFGIYIQCKIIFFELNKVIQIIDLLQYQCQIEVVDKSVFLLNKKEKYLIYLSYKNQQIFQIKMQIEDQNNLNISDLRIDDLGRWILLLYSDSLQNQFSIIRYNKNILTQNLVKISSKVSSNYFFDYNNEQYLLIGLEDSSIILYYLNYLANDQEQIFKMIQSIKLNKGNVYQFRFVEYENDSKTKQLNVYVTTKFRIFLLQTNLNSKQKIPEESFEIKNFKFTHTRSYSLLKILGNQFVAVMSQIQVTIYSQTLQYICRMEEKQFINVNDVFLTPDNRQFIITDNNNVYSYSIVKINARERLLLQQQTSFKYPILYSIEKINDSKQYMIYGVAIDQFIKIRYNSFSFDQNQDCLRYLTNFDSIEEQQYQYNQILQQSKNTQFKNIQMAINIHKSQKILLPDYIFNENVNQSIINTISLEIDLQNYEVELYQLYNKNNKNILKQLKIINGKLVVVNPLLFLDMESIIFSNIKIIYQTENIKFDLNNIPKFTFNQVEKLTFDAITIEDKNIYLNEKDTSGVFLYNLQKIQEIQIRSFKILNSHFTIGLFSILQSNQTNLSNFTIKGCIFDSNGPQLLFKDTESIKIKTINTTESFLTQLLYFENTKKMSIQEIHIKNIDINKKKSIRRLDINQQILSNNEEENIKQQSLISIVYNLESCSIINLNMFDSTQNILLFYTNEQNRFQNDSESDISQKYISKNSTLTINDMHIVNVKSKYRLIDVKQSDIQLKNITLKNNINCSCYFQNSTQNIKIEQFFIHNNNLALLPLLRFENSIINIKTINIQNIKVISNQINTSPQGCIYIQNSDFTIVDLQGYNNEGVDHFIIINSNFTEQEQQNKNADYLKNYIKDSKISFTKGGGIMVQNFYDLKINDTFLENNVDAEKGSGIYLENVKKCKLVNVTIKNNTAKISGGGIYLEQSDLQISKCTIQDNTAKIGGGIRYNNTEILPSFLKNDTSSQIQQNNASIFGNNFCSFPHHLEMVELTIDQIKSIMNKDDEIELTSYKNAVSSTSQQVTIISFKLYDENNDLIKLPQHESDQKKLNQELSKYYKFQLKQIDEKQVIISNTNEISQYYEQFNCFVLMKYITNSGYKNEKEKHQNKSIDMQIKSLENFQFNFPDIEVKQEPLIKNFSLWFRPCLKGEIILNEGEILNDLDYYYICQKCEENTYSLEDPYQSNTTPNLQCKNCPQHATCKYGNEIIPSYGYWNERWSDQVHECVNAKFACQYDDKQKFSCTEGYYGPLCESCDYENKKWGRDNETNEVIKKFAKKGKYNCTECSDRISLQNQIILSVVIGVVFIGYLAYQINSNLETKKLKYQTIYLQRCGLLYISNSIEQNEKTSVLIKIILSYLQLIVIINGFHINPPQFLKISLSVGNVLESTAYSVDCLFVNMGFIKSIPIIYLRLLWNLLQPIIYIFILSIIFSIIVRQQRNQKKRNLIISGLLKVYYMIFPQIVQYTIGCLSCKYINGNYFILNDLQYECFDSNYYIFNFAIGLPYLIFIVLIPYFLYRQLKANSHQLNKNLNVFLSYGFFFAEFRKQYCYWEVIRLYEKIFTYVIIGIFNQDNMVSSIFMSAIIILYMRLLIVLKPFTFNEFNNIDLLSQLTAVVTILCMVINSTTDKEYLRILSLLVVVLANLYFFYRIILCIFQNILPTQVLKIIQKVQEKLHNSKPKIFQKPKNITVNIVNVSKNWKKVKVSLSKNNIQSIYNTKAASLILSQIRNTNQNLITLNKKNVKSGFFKEPQTEKCLDAVPEIIDKKTCISIDHDDENDNYESIFQNVNAIKLQQYNSNQITLVDYNSKANLNFNPNNKEEENEPKKKTSLENSFKSN